MSTPGAASSRRPLRFVVVGAINTAISYACYVALLEAGLSLPVAGLVSLATGIGCGFLLQGRFVFGHVSAPAFVRFVLTWSLLYAVHLGVVLGLRNWGIDPRIGALAALCVLTVLSYLLQRDVVFASRHRNSR